MTKLARPTTTLILLTGTLLLSSCSQATDNRIKSTSAPSSVVSLSPAATQPTPVKPSSQPKVDPYQQALTKAASAQSISQSAQSQDDWKLVASRWEQAIQLLKKVPKGSPYRVLVQSKLSNYQRNLAYVNQQAARKPSNEAVPLDPGLIISSAGTSQSASETSQTSPERGNVFRAKIKRRAGGTPVIDVTFNGRQTFEMIVDTGASGTVITQQMANALGSRAVGKARVTTASDRNVEVPLTYVDSISVGGATIRGVVVAIGGSALDVGLLGHDFFGDYDVTVRRDVVEFRARS